MTELIVAERVLDLLAAACDAAAPAEACGLLLGECALNRGVATNIVVARNSASEPGAFEIADRELRRCLLHAQDRGLQVVALFHSHTSGESRLSESDRLGLRHSAWPWLIVTASRDGASVRLDLAVYQAGDGSAATVVPRAWTLFSPGDQTLPAAPTRAILGAPPAR